MAGIILVGASTANAATFVTDESVTASTQKYPQHYDSIANLTSGLRNMMYGLGQCSGALFGCILRKWLGFPHALELLSLFYILLAIYGALQVTKCLGSKE